VGLKYRTDLTNSKVGNVLYHSWREEVLKIINNVKYERRDQK
jgi:hypothetical protein